MSTQNNSNGSAITLRELIKTPWTYMVIMLVIIGGYNDIKTFCAETFPDQCPLQPQLELQFDSPEAHIGKDIILTYTLPRYGYFSLWNKNAQGKTERFYPKSLQHTVQLSKQNYRGSQKLRPDAANAEEDVIVIWSRKPLIKPPDPVYQSSTAFKDYLETYKKYIKTASISIQVLE